MLRHRLPGHHHRTADPQGAQRGDHIAVPADERHPQQQQCRTNPDHVDTLPYVRPDPRSPWVQYGILAQRPDSRKRLRRRFQGLGIRGRRIMHTAQQQRDTSAMHEIPGALLSTSITTRRNVRAATATSSVTKTASAATGPAARRGSTGILPRKYPTRSAEGRPSSSAADPVAANSPRATFRTMTFRGNGCRETSGPGYGLRRSYARSSFRQNNDGSYFSIIDFKIRQISRMQRESLPQPRRKPHEAAARGCAVC